MTTITVINVIAAPRPVSIIVQGPIDVDIPVFVRYVDIPKEWPITTIVPNDETDYEVDSPL